ncbi:hypothetical protein LEN26_000425 [Aphanomyces euteiches]|nr:hypothetical protein LEN26_000425 [Aphanomyces euteiches]
MGLPFRAVENEHFQLFIQRYLPQFQVPTRERIGGDLLGKVYLLEKKSVIEHLQTQRYLSVVTDGWTDPNNNYVVNFMVVTPSMRPMFWSSVRTEDAAHDASTISKKLLEVIDDIERAYGNLKVCSVVTDNASVMTKVWHELQILKPWIICNGCAAHASNLIIGKLFDVKFASGIFYDKLSKAKVLTKFLKKRTALSFRFREQQKLSIPRGQTRHAQSLPVSTRWYSSEHCIRNVVRNQEVFDHGHSKDKLSEVLEILADLIFCHQAKHILSYTEPITNALTILERDKSFGSMVYEQFKCMLTHPVYGSQEERNEVQRDIIDVIRSRWRSFHTPVMLVSFLLDPTKSLHEFLPDDKCIVISAAPHVAEKAGYTGNRLKNLKKELENFVAKKDQWPIKVLNRNHTKSPTLWWI